MATNKKGKTFSLRNYLAIILTSVALLIVPFGCAHRPQVQAPIFPKFTEAELGRIAVASACFEPLFEYFKPLTKGKAAAQGAEEALMGFLEGIIGNPSAVGAIVLSPVIAAGGAIYGTIEGETTETTRKAEETLNHSFTDLGIQKVMQDRVPSLARERARYTFVEPEQCGPKVLKESSYRSLWRLGSCSGLLSAPPPCGSLGFRLASVD